MTAPAPGQPPSDPDKMSTPQLIGQAVDNATALLKDEVALAKAEIKQTVRDVGKGVGMFGAAGVLALYGLGALVATIIMGLGVVIEPWIAALIVTVVLFAGAAVMAFMGKKKVSDAPPPIDKTQANLHRDVDTMKEASS